MSERTELTKRIDEMKTLIAELESEGLEAWTQKEILARYEAALDNTPAETDRSHSLTARPKAGAAAKNQYGTFEVSYATQKQTNYIKMLMDTRDLSNADQSKIDLVELRQQVAATQVNKKAASAIIDFLLALPELKRPVVAHQDDLGAPATDKQKAFVRSLLAEREGLPAVEGIRQVLNVARSECKLTAKLMSTVIDELTKIPVQSNIPDGRYALPADDGHFVFYKVDNVTEGKWAGYTFVVQLVGSVGDWNEQRLSRAVSDNVKSRIAADVEEAARMFGIKARACGYCCSPLSNIQSRAAGYGEKCAENNGLHYPTEGEAREILAERGEEV